MGEDFVMPSLGADMDDGVITEWRVAPGDEVGRGQIIVVVETDKSDIEVEIFRPAIIDELLVAEGERVAVGTPIARLRPVGSATAAGSPTTGSPAVESPPVESPPVESPPVESPPVESPPSDHDRVAPTTVTSPLVRHLAERLHVDTASIDGSGPGGRVHRADVEAASRPERPRRITPRARRIAAERGLDIDRLPAGLVTGDDVLGLPTAVGESGAPEPDPARRAVASLMTRSWAEIPHFHVGRRLDVGTVVDRLTTINAERPVGERILPVAVVLHAVARAAAEIGSVNGWWRNGRFEAAARVDLGVIVARRQGGIIAPRLTAVEEMSVDEVMVGLVDLVRRARSGRLRTSDVGPASITVSNLGDLGADYVHGVIHPPQVALVGVGSIHDAAVALDGAVAVRPVLEATLTGDHRALDGLVGARFLDVVARRLVDSALSIPQRRAELTDQVDQIDQDDRTAQQDRKDPGVETTAVPPSDHREIDSVTGDE